jgi:hypothetical protein
VEAEQAEEDTAAKVQAVIQAQEDLMGAKEEIRRRDQARHTPTQGAVPPLDPAPHASLVDTIPAGLLFLIVQGSCRHWV